jgi:hypothetical protein
MRRRRSKVPPLVMPPEMGYSPSQLVYIRQKMEALDRLPPEVREVIRTNRYDTVNPVKQLSAARVLRPAIHAANLRASDDNLFLVRGMGNCRR